MRRSRSDVICWLRQTLGVVRGFSGAGGPRCPSSPRPPSRPSAIVFTRPAAARLPSRPPLDAIYPDSHECCRVCDTAEYCGIVSPSWLQVNSTYEGERRIGGLDCVGFMKQGGEQNYYFAEKTTQQPCEYYEGYPVLPNTSNYWRFVTSNFSRAAIPASVFAVPVGWGCEFMCPQSGMTYAERLAARAAAGVGAPIAARAI
jgi:hypothetical protein